MGFGQKVVENTYFPDVDEPLQFNYELSKTKFRIIENYSVSDTNFKVANSACSRREFYDDSGRLFKLVSGLDIDRKKIYYIVNYTSTSDTVCHVLTEYMAKYVDSLSLFMYDTIIKGKYKRNDIYKRELDGNLIVNSIVRYETGKTLPKIIERFDRDGSLKQIYYPLGNRIPLREWTDSLFANETKTVFYNAIYRENEYYACDKYSRKGLLLESGYSNYTPNSTPDIQNTIFIYGDSSMLLFKHSYGPNNVFRQSERFIYQDGILRKRILDYDPNDNIDNKTWIYNAKGQLIERHNTSTNFQRSDWKWVYIYKNDLQVRADYYFKQEYSYSTHFIYK
jgi:hypothetical protein